MSKHLALALVLATLLAACSPQKPAPASEDAPKFNTELDMKEFMGHVMDPSAFGYWKGSGSEITAAGEKSLAPTTEEGWEALESSAAVLIEAGNMLQLADRPRAPAAHWNQYAQRLTAEAVLAKAAAGKHDEAAVFTAGAKVYEVCTACHKEYVIDPSIKANGPAKGLPLPDWPADVKTRQTAFDARQKP